MAALAIDLAAWGTSLLLSAPFLLIDGYLAYLLWKAGGRFQDAPQCLARAWPALMALKRRVAGDD